VCANVDDKVVDSRMSEDGTSIRRRRECLGCGRRFTTFERLEELPFLVIKRSGEREPFARAKIVAGLQAAAKARPVTEQALEQLAADVEEEMRLVGAEVTTEVVGLAVLERLRDVDEVAYLRFASVYRSFSSIEDFEKEIADLRRPTGADPPD